MTVHSNRRVSYVIKIFASRQNCAFLVGVNVLLLCITTRACMCVHVSMFWLVLCSGGCDVGMTTSTGGLSVYMWIPVAFPVCLL